MKTSFPKGFSCLPCPPCCTLHCGMSSLVPSNRLVLDWLSSPASHLAVWNVLLHRDPWTVAPTSQENISELKGPFTPDRTSCSYANINNRSLFRCFPLKTKATTSSRCCCSPPALRWHVTPAARRLRGHASTSLSHAATFQTPIFWASGSSQSLATCWHTSGGLRGESGNLLPVQ